MRISVDLPAPFCPSSTCTVPASTVSETSSSARTPGNVLEIPRMSSRGATPAELYRRHSYHQRFQRFQGFGSTIARTSRTFCEPKAPLAPLERREPLAPLEPLEPLEPLTI